jgi:Spy/CpxP family protein refolding chaperone
MKKKIAILGVVAAFVIAGAAFATARVVGRIERRSESRMWEQDGLGGEHGFGGHIMGRMAKQLNLTDDQKTQIKGIVAAEKPTVQPLFEQLKANRQALKAATANGQFDESQVRQLASQQAQTVASLIVEKERVKAKIYGVLTPEQRTKAEQMRTKFESRMKERSQGHEKESGESK